MNTHIPTADAHAEIVAVRTGQNCPETGWWQPLQSENMSEVQASRFIGKGCPMPAAGGLPAIWIQGRNSFQQTDY
jgi:hypothetical protein